MVKFSVPFWFVVAVLMTSLQFIYATFSIDYDNNTFTMDGRPFRYISGSAHYFRMPHEYWRDRLRKIRAAGLNAVSTYVEWSQHESIPGQYNFTGDLNITEYLRIAQEEDLYVLFRPGPYICAERDMGGLPYWLLTKHPNVKLRSSDVNFTKYAHQWLHVLMPQVVPFLYGNGGPIILVQVENEYGSYDLCDLNYTKTLRDLFARYVGDKAVLYTTDGASHKFLKCGKIPGVYATVDFGPDYNVTHAFHVQRRYEARGPLINSEYYPGWLTHWGEPIAHKETTAVVSTLRKMLNLGANVNFYMFYGGTNFGFTAGANGGNRSYQSDITSYDYDAPISEAGDLTEKYFAIQDVVREYLPLPNISAKTCGKGDYGQLHLKPTASLFSPKIRSTLGVLNRNRYPLSFEELGQNFGYLLYETEIKSTSTVSQPLFIKNLHDYARVFVNARDVGNFSRELKIHEIFIKPVNQGDKLGILVENLGRINYGPFNNDSKGILSDVLLGNNVLNDWNMTSFELNSLESIERCFNEDDNFDCHNYDSLVFYMTKFVIHANGSDESYPNDTFIDVSNLTKGLIFVNGFNLGRYWPTRGPQKTLYLPGVYLKFFPSENVIIALDESLSSDKLTLKFSKKPVFHDSQ